jgi:lysophospholipase L1-like esterase
MSARRALLTSLLVSLATCGGSPSTPTPSASGSAGRAQSVSVLVFYDENGNGALDGGEATRVPDVEVSLGGRSGRSAAGTGRAVIDGVAAGTFMPAVSAASLPPFFAVGRLSSVQVPATGDVAVPLTLAIGSNRPNTYMAFGDSITEGDNYPGDPSYRALLADKLRQYFGQATVLNEGAGSTKSFQGAERIAGVLASDRPAYTLILYGANDWNRSECKHPEQLGTTCFTVSSMRDMVAAAKAASSLPVLATIPPANENFDQFSPPQRNEFNAAANVQIRDIARSQGVPLADLEKAFLAAGNDPSLFVDHVHPSAKGEEIIATTFFQTIAHAAGPGAARATSHSN